MGIMTHRCARARDALRTFLRRTTATHDAARVPDVFTETARRAPRTAAELRIYCAQRHAGLTPIPDVGDWGQEAVWRDLARDLDAGTVVALYPDGTDQPATFVWASQATPPATGPVTS